jgi:hypothetical protein
MTEHKEIIIHGSPWRPPPITLALLFSLFLMMMLTDLIFNMSPSVDSRRPPITSQGRELFTAGERAEQFGWFGVRIDRAPTRYLNSSLIFDRLTRDDGCQIVAYEGDLISIIRDKDYCRSQRSRLTARARLALGLKLNINHASLADLKRVSGIGDARAQQIIERRPWRALESLTALKGVGHRSVHRWSALLTTVPPKRLWPKVRAEIRGSDGL